MSVKSGWWLIAMLATSVAFADPPLRMLVEVTEPTGVQRDGAPVHVRLILPRPATATTPFRLLHAGQPVTAQFRPQSGRAESSVWWLDFVASSAPFETRQYTIEYGPGVEAGPERTQGHSLIENAESWVVSNAPYIDWTVPRDFRGLLRSVDFAPNEHLRPDSLGLYMLDRDGNPHPLGGADTAAHVVRQGKMAVALQFEKTETSDALRGVGWTADLVFPGPVSWVDMHLVINDPADRVAEVGLQLNLNLDPPSPASRTLVELGAARTIYRSLLADTEVELRADRHSASPWQVLRGTSRSLQTFVVAADNSPPAEGWAHVMDRKRCLAIAFEQFGGAGEERLNIRADGTLTAERRFAAKPDDGGEAKKHWRMWLHFVHFPPEQSAATDPHMMQNPLLVRQVD